MAHLTRVSLLKKTSAGALIAGALALVPGGTALMARRENASLSEADVMRMDTAAPFVAYVRNPTSGALVMVVGNEEITVHDPALVARLLKAQSHASRRPTQAVVR